MVGAQIRQLRLGFDAFRHHGQAEAAGQRNDGAHDGGIVVVARDVMDERAVDFQAVNGKSLQVAERRVAGAEIVHRDADAQGLQSGQHAGC